MAKSDSKRISDLEKRVYNLETIQDIIVNRLTNELDIHIYGELGEKLRKE